MYPLRRVICGIDLGGPVLRLAVAERRRDRVVVRSLTSRARDPERPLAAQVADALRACVQPAHEVHLAVAGEWATYRTLTFPFSGGRALDAAVPPALTALLPFTPGDGVVAYEAIGREEGGGTAVCAAFGRRQEIAGLIDDLAAAGCAVDSVLPAPLPGLRVVADLLREEPEAIFLDTAPVAPTLALLRAGSPYLLRVLRPPAVPERNLDARIIVDELRWTLAAAARSSRPSIVIGGRADVVDAIVPLLSLQLHLPVRRLEDLPITGVPHDLRASQGQYATALGLALGARRTRPTGHGFEVAGSSPRASEARALRQEVRRTRAVAAAILALLTLHAGLDWTAARRRLERAERMLRSGLAAVSRPDDAVGSVDELQQRVARLDAGCSAPDGCGGPLALLERLSRAIPAGLDVVIESIEMEGGTARVEGRAASIATVDQLRSALAGFGDLVAPSAGADAVLDGTQQPVTSGAGSVSFRLQTDEGAGARPPRSGQAVDA